MRRNKKKTVLATDLAEDIRIRVILQKHCSCARVIIPCCNVQSRQPHLPLGTIVDEQSYDILMPLLKSHGERRESILQHKRECQTRG